MREGSEEQCPSFSAAADSIIAPQNNHRFLLSIHTFQASVLSGISVTFSGLLIGILLFNSNMMATGTLSDPGG